MPNLAGYLSIKRLSGATDMQPRGWRSIVKLLGYGLIAVALAAFAGWGAGQIFRKR